MTNQNHTADTARATMQARVEGGSGKIPNQSQKTICVDTNAVLGQLSQSWQQRLEQASADRGNETSAKTIRVDMESILSHMAKTRSTQTQTQTQTPTANKRRLSVRATVLATIALLAVLGLVFIV